jgi:hypothetical protein
MSALLISFLAFSAWSGLASAINNNTQILGCRNVPGDAGFSYKCAMGSSLLGRLVRVVPFVEFCSTQGGRTTQQFTSSAFRAGVPVAMNQVKLSSLISAFNGS